ncbi:hypothetical protein HanOQP8_Chr08g0278091 [Helianthus annuus]|nr:hypothetical protein HanOQP8_Chr08g0278091 [Helianthus annuus]
MHLIFHTSNPSPLLPFHSNLCISTLRQPEPKSGELRRPPFSPLKNHHHPPPPSFSFSHQPHEEKSYNARSPELVRDRSSRRSCLAMFRLPNT